VSTGEYLEHERRDPKYPIPARLAVGYPKIEPFRVPGTDDAMAALSLAISARASVAQYATRARERLAEAEGALPILRQAVIDLDAEVEATERWVREMAREVSR
jgi:hypothetical protein